MSNTVHMGYSVFGFLTILLEKLQPGDRPCRGLSGFGNPSHSKTMVHFRITYTLPMHMYRLGNLYPQTTP